MFATAWPLSQSGQIVRGSQIFNLRVDGDMSPCKYMERPRIANLVLNISFSKLIDSKAPRRRDCSNCGETRGQDGGP